MRLGKDIAYLKKRKFILCRDVIALKKATILIHNNFHAFQTN
jgi:hypothetical protein